MEDHVRLPTAEEAFAPYVRLARRRADDREPLAATYPDVVARAGTSDLAVGFPPTAIKIPYTHSVVDNIGDRSSSTGRGLFSRIDNARER